MCHKIKLVAEINISEQNKEVAEIRNGHRIYVLGNEEDSFLN